MRHVLAIDQSTSATKALLFDENGSVVDRESIGHRQFYPRPGWVEHDAEQIYQNTVRSLTLVCERNRSLLDRIICMSLTNQRETVVVFDRDGKPLTRAMVWQCRRGQEICRELIERGYSEKIQRKTGLKIDTYFSAPKLRWLVGEDRQIGAKLRSGEAFIGTIDTFLIYRLTRGNLFATDHTNASRTLLYDIGHLRWDEELTDLFGVPMQALPEVRESSSRFGETDIDGLLDSPIPICGVMGDSQAALFAQGCFHAGMAKVTLGTGSSVLLTIGDELRLSDKGIVTTIGWVYDGTPTYAFEGIINYAGATVSWLKEQLGLISDPAETESLAISVADNGGVYLVPAFVGLSAPYWQPRAKALISGLTPSSTRAHIARAALEAIAYRIKDVLHLMVSESGVVVQRINADGGMVNNRFLMQFVADIIGIDVRASKLSELSPLGAVLSGLLGMGRFKSLRDIENLPRGFTDYSPIMPSEEAARYYKGWRDTVNMLISSQNTEDKDE